MLFYEDDSLSGKYILKCFDIYWDCCKVVGLFVYAYTHRLTDYKKYHLNVFIIALSPATRTLYFKFKFLVEYADVFFYDFFISFLKWETNILN